MPWSSTTTTTSSPSARPTQVTRPYWGENFTAFSSRLYTAEVSWRRSPSTTTGGIGSSSGDFDLQLVRRLADALCGFCHHEVDQHRLARRRLLVLDAREVEEVVNDPADAEGLGVDPVRESLGDLRLVLRKQRLGKQPDRAHGRLQLVTDVRDEVTPDVFEAAALRYVLDDGNQPEGALAVVDALRTHDQGPTRRAVKLEHTFIRGPRRRRGDELFDRLSCESVPMPASDERDGLAVAEDGLATARR